ncbi:hypothetical protein [Halioxenophilus aromaticivorans]|uniref:Uncharacterized protein n=1 Tax=Halioxenophilus aromaticivorans TaxID=1306992 RepID=A0AAV3TX90_9ALTE
MIKHSAQINLSDNKPVSTPASIFETPEAEHCPYVSLAILYLPKLHTQTWDTIFAMSETRDDLTNHMIAEQLADAICTLNDKDRTALCVTLDEKYEDCDLLDLILDKTQHFAAQ